MKRSQYTCMGLVALLLFATSHATAQPKSIPEAVMAARRAVVGIAIAFVRGSGVVVECAPQLVERLPDYAFCVVTSWHVIDDFGVAPVTVTTSSGEAYRVHGVTAVDRLADLAKIVIVPKAGTPTLRPLPLAVDVRVGDAATFIAEANLQAGPPVVRGHIVRVGPVTDIGNLILAHAPVVQGMSGGALVNDAGELVGIIRLRVHNDAGLAVGMERLGALQEEKPLSLLEAQRRWLPVLHSDGYNRGMNMLRNAAFYDRRGEPAKRSASLAAAEEFFAAVVGASDTASALFVEEAWLQLGLSRLLQSEFAEARKAFSRGMELLTPDHWHLPGRRLQMLARFNSAIAESYAKQRTALLEVEAEAEVAKLWQAEINHYLLARRYLNELLPKDIPTFRAASTPGCCALFAHDMVDLSVIVERLAETIAAAEDGRVELQFAGLHPPSLLAEAKQLLGGGICLNNDLDFFRAHRERYRTLEALTTTPPVRSLPAVQSGKEFGKVPL